MKNNTSMRKIVIAFNIGLYVGQTDDDNRKNELLGVLKEELTEDEFLAIEDSLEAVATGLRNKADKKG